MSQNINIEKLNYTWLFSAVMDWIIIVSAIYLSYLSYWFLPLTVFIVGNRQHALTILGHDGAHYLVSKNKKVNDFLTNFFIFFPLAISIKNYRDFHFSHHRNTNNDKDPELPLKNIPPKIKKPVTARKIKWQALGDLIGFGIPQIIAFMYKIRPRRIKETAAILMVFIIGGILSYYGLILAVLLWNLSLLTAFWFCFRLRVWTEHVGLGEGETLRFDPKWWQILLFLPHNTWLHAEHHDNPAVAFNKLPTLREEKTGLSLAQARKQQQ